MKFDTNKMVKIAVLSALAVVLMLILRFPIIPSAAYLEYDPADIPVLIGGFMYGPVAGLIITLIVSFIQAVTVSAASGWIGFAMHVIATGTLVIVSSLIYKKIHNFKGAIIALIAGSIAMTLVMIPSNLYFGPKFGVPIEAVKAGLTVAVIPFNLLKSCINSVITMLLYKPLSRVLKGLGSERRLQAKTKN
ncbi:MAG TPA: ECF transporter S component [Clostridiales bacterium]|nr:ECF transporter S component [Clostridiales bacterium]